MDCSVFFAFSKDDEDANSSTKEVTLEDMYSAAKEVDGTGTVDTTSNAAERLKLNQATSTAGENSNQQVTVQRKRPATPPGSLFLSSLYSLIYNPILFTCSHNYHTLYLPLPSSRFSCIILLK